MKITFSFFVLIILLYPYLYSAAKSLEHLHFYVYMPIHRLVEGDWIAKDVKKNNKIVLHTKDSITKKDIKELKESNIKQVLIKDGIPFVPPFLIGTILALIMGNPFF